MSNLPLGNFMDALSKEDPALILKTQNNSTIAGVGSYRGYYDELCLYPSMGQEENFLHVGQLLKILDEDVIDQELRGYKGGEYLMTVDTPLWIAPHGNTGDPLTDTKVVGDTFVLISAIY